jgi:uncharacterized protein
VERKRIAGMRPAERPADAAATAAVYAESTTRLVYERLAALAGIVLDAGVTAVVDATCTQRWQRAVIARAAADRGVPIIWVAFDVPASELVTRVTRRQARGDDPSDASADIVLRQVAGCEPLAAEEVGSRAAVVRVTADAGGPRAVADRVVEAWHTITQGEAREERR